MTSKRYYILDEHNLSDKSDFCDKSKGYEQISNNEVLNLLNQLHFQKIFASSLEKNLERCQMRNIMLKKDFEKLYQLLLDNGISHEELQEKLYKPVGALRL